MDGFENRRAERNPQRSAGAENGAGHEARFGAGFGARRRGAGRSAPAAPYSLAEPGRYGGGTAAAGATAAVAAGPLARLPARGNGAARGARNGAEVGAGYDAELVLYRLEEAGATLLALPQSGYSTRLAQTSLLCVRSALESYGWQTARLAPPVPSAQRISRMDEALGWIGLIPQARYVLRRIVGARALVSPLTERHLYTWRRLGGLLGADHKAVQRWHAEGIDRIVAALNGGGG